MQQNALRLDVCRREGDWRTRIQERYEYDAGILFKQNWKTGVALKDGIDGWQKERECPPDSSH